MNRDNRQLGTEGDWNGDGVFSSTDFVFAFQAGGYESGPREGGLQVVPEPATSVLIAFGTLVLGLTRKRMTGVLKDKPPKSAEP